MAALAVQKSGLHSLRGPASWQMQRLTESARAACNMCPVTPPKRNSGLAAQHAPGSPAPGLLSSVLLGGCERPQVRPHLKVWDWGARSWS